MVVCVALGTPFGELELVELSHGPTDLLVSFFKIVAI